MNEKYEEIDEKLILKEDAKLYRDLKEAYDYNYSILNDENLDNTLPIEQIKLEMDNALNQIKDLEKKSYLQMDFIEYNNKLLISDYYEEYINLKKQRDEIYKVIDDNAEYGYTPEMLESDKKALSDIEAKLEKIEALSKSNLHIKEYDGKYLLEKDLEEYKNLIEERERAYDALNDNAEYGYTPEMLEEDKKHLEDIETRIKNMEDLGQKSYNTLNPETPKKHTEDSNESSTDENSDNFEPTGDDLKDLFNITKQALVEGIDPEQKENILQQLDEIIDKIFERDEKIFEDKLAELNTVESKIDLIDKREEQIKNYSELYTSNNPNRDSMLKDRYEQIKIKLDNKYREIKAKGEYCFKNSLKIKESMEYINNTIRNDSIKNEKFNKLLDSLIEARQTNNAEKISNFNNELDNFVHNFNLNKDKLLPYMEAYADVNKNKKIKKEEPTHTIPPTNKKRRKVIKKEKGIKGWFKSYPKLKWLAIGLAVTATLPLTSVVLMQIFSGGWLIAQHLPVIGEGLGSVFHGLNVGLSKIALGGGFKYAAATGEYLKGGIAGAEALYTAASAKCMTALAALAGATPIAKKIADKIVNKREKKKQQLKEKEAKKESTGNNNIIEEEQEKVQETEPVISEKSNENGNPSVEEYNRLKQELEELKKYLENLGLDPQSANLNPEEEVSMKK